MTSVPFEPSMILAILPEIGILLLASIALVLDLVWRDKRCGRLAMFTAVGLLVVAGISVLFARPGDEAQLIFGGMLRHDALGFVFRMIFILAAAVISLLTIGENDLCVHGEFYVMLLVSVLGMNLMAASADLVMLFLAIETTSIPLYVLAGFKNREKRSVEAGIKYLLFGAMTSAVMLYGFTLLYGFTGTTQIYQIAERLTAGEVALVPIGMAMVLILAGLGFKISAVPFHFWAPDVYEGAPTLISGFLSTASKAAGFAVLVRVLQFAFPPESSHIWTGLVIALSIASMIVGNYLALAQKDLKRLLAYSSIAQAGYILIGVAANSSLGISGAVYYLMGYLVTNLAAFGVISIVERYTGSSDVSAFQGLSKRSQALGLLMLAALLSLGGVPPFAGFFGKLLVFGAAIESGLWWLAVIGILLSVVALYYYLMVLKAIYQPPTEKIVAAIQIRVPGRVALITCAAGILILGVFFAPWYEWALRVASMIF